MPNRKKPDDSHCDSSALSIAQDLVFNPTHGKSVEEIETAQALFKLYNSLRYGFKALLIGFINDRQYQSVRDQLPRRDSDSPEAMSEYKEARKRLIYNPVKAAVEAFMEANLQTAGTEAEWLRGYGTNSESTIRALIERLLDLAVERYWAEVQLNPDSEKRQPEMIKVRLEDGEAIAVTPEEQRKYMRQCLLRLNQQELDAKQRQFGARTNTHNPSHIDTVMARGGAVAKPGASNFVVTDAQSELGQYAVVSFDFNSSQWECLARVRNQQSSFTYADQQRKVALPGALIRAFRDTQNEFPLGKVGTLQDMDAKWRKPLQIPHLQNVEGQAPVLVSFADTKQLEGTWYMGALTEMLEQYKAQFLQQSWQPKPEAVSAQ